MPTSISELELSASQIRILKMIRNRGSIPISKVKKHQNKKYKFLFYYSLLDLNPDNHNEYCLSLKAENYLRYRKKQTIKFYVPLLISVLALFVSIISLIVSILK